MSNNASSVSWKPGNIASRSGTACSFHPEPHRGHPTKSIHSKNRHVLSLLSPGINMHCTTTITWCERMVGVLFPRVEPDDSIFECAGSIRPERDFCLVQSTTGVSFVPQTWHLLPPRLALGSNSPEIGALSHHMRPRQKKRLRCTLFPPSCQPSDFERTGSWTWGFHLIFSNE